MYIVSKYRRKNSASRCNRRGAAAVEFALIASVLFMVIFGCIEFSRMILLRNMAQDAAYDAARYCMVEGATSAEAITRANAVLRKLNARGAVVTVNNGVPLTSSSTDVNVQINIPMENNSIFFKPVFRNRNINVAISLKKETYIGYYDAN
jgi:Flp pilus assembly protein TadG